MRTFRRVCALFRVVWKRMCIRAGHHYLFSTKNFAYSFFFVCFYIYKLGGKLKKRFFWSYLLFFDRQVCVDPFISQKKNGSVYELHGTQNNRLELTVSTQKTVLKKTHRVPRYWPKSLKIMRFGLATSILAHFGQYLGTWCVFFEIVFCVETVSSSRSFWVPWSP